MKKLITYLLLVALCLSLTFITAYAEGETVEEPAAKTETVEEEPAPTMTAQFVDFLGEHLTEIFSALAALGTVIISASYKRGLMPTLSNGLGTFVTTMQDGLKSANEAVASLKNASDDKLNAIADKVAPFIEKSDEIVECVGKIDDKVKDMEAKITAEQGDREKLSYILKAQMEMFYQFFQSVNLPQYQKDRLGEYYNSVNKTIAAMTEEKGGE